VVEIKICGVAVLMNFMDMNIKIENVLNKCNGTTVNDDLEGGSPGLFPMYYNGIPLEKLKETTAFHQNSVNTADIRAGYVPCLSVRCYRYTSLVGSHLHISWVTFRVLFCMLSVAYCCKRYTRLELNTSTWEEPG
jgi:hypothetical protein